MKIHEIIAEAPEMVPQDRYPAELADDAEQWLQSVTDDPSELKEKFRDGNIRIMSLEGVHLFLFDGDTAVGHMHLVDAKNLKKVIGKRAWQVMNVYVKPEYRNQRLGIMLYDYILHHRKHAFASGAQMTPSSRRIYTSKLKDPSVDVYGLVKDFSGATKGDLYTYGAAMKYERIELRAGSDGVTTGDRHLDHMTTFVMIAK